MKVIHAFVFIAYLFSLAYVSASIDRSEFVVSGCNYMGEGLEKGSCSSDGRAYCSKNGVILDTISDSGACSFEKGSLSPGLAQCCPAGYVCSNESGDLRCRLRTKDCTSYTNIADCQSNSCFWIPPSQRDNGRCVDRPTDLSCDAYKDELSCKQDLWNIGKEGMGTEICGKYINISGNRTYIVSKSQCRCSWEIKQGFGRCVLKYEIKPEFIYGNEKSFICEKKFSSSSCFQGKQTISWESSIFPSFGLPANLAQESRCVSGNKTRTCGIPTIKLPFTNTTSILISLLILTFFYLVNSLNKKILT